MNINIRLDKNFTTQYNKLQAEFGTEIAKINGFDDGQLSYTDFIDNFVDEDTVADSSIDGNSNVYHKDIVTLEKEMPKPHEKLLAFNKIYYEIQKKYGFQAANEWLSMEWSGKLYMHDANTSTFKSYCFAYDLKDLAEKGLYFIEGRNSKPAQHLITWIDFVKEFISYASNRTSGACGLPNLIPYTYYFWKKDVEDGYVVKNPEYYAKQAFQRFIYAVNQPYVRDSSQSAFTNTSVFDRPYFEALFGGATFPDGTFMIDDEEEIINFQKWYMEEMAEIRSENMFTFPVSTISLLRQDGKFVDEDFAVWAIKHNMKWSDSNLFVDTSVNSLSNCPLSGDTEVLYYSDRYNSYYVSPIKEIYNNLEKSGKDKVKVLSNGEEIECKINKFNIPIEYEIKLVNGATIKTTGNHLNKVFGKDYVESKNLTTEDYLPISLTPFEKTKNLSYEDGKLIGMFLGDGSYNDDNTIVFSLNKTSKIDLINFLYSYCPNHYGAIVREYGCISDLSGKESCFNVRVKSKSLKGLIEDFVIGDNALNKGINPNVCLQSIEFRKGILDGLYETDGGNSNRIYTSSEQLKDDLITMLATMGMACTISEDDREGRLGTNVNYTVRFYTPNGRTQRKDFYKIADGYFWIKIKEINKLQNKQSVSYCFEVVDEDIEPIFMLANGVLTHNCRLKSNIEDLG